MATRLSASVIDSLASRPGVRRIAVENFLGSAPANLTRAESAANMRYDARLYRWNEATQEAILTGLQQMYGAPPWSRGGVRRNPMGRVTVDEWYDNFSDPDHYDHSPRTPKDRKVWRARVFQDSDTNEWVFEAASGVPGRIGKWRELARSRSYRAVSDAYIKHAVYTKGYQGFYKSSEAAANDPAMAGETAAQAKAHRAGAGARRKHHEDYQRQQRAEESQWWRDRAGSSSYGGASGQRTAPPPPPPPPAGPHAVLGVRQGAPWPEVRAAWKTQIAEWHPDRNRSPEALRRAQDINQAFQVLQKSYGMRNPTWPLAWVVLGLVAYGWWERQRA